QRVEWSKVGQIVASWVVSPALAGALSFIIFTIIQRRVLFQRDLVHASRSTAPYFVFAVVFTLTLVTLWKGLKPLKLDFDLWEACALASILSLIGAVAAIPVFARIAAAANGKDQEPEGSAANPIVAEELERLETRTRRLMVIATGEIREGLRRIRNDFATLRGQIVLPERRGPDWGTSELRSVEQMFTYLQVMSACAVAFAHGANDVANAIGPVQGILRVLHDSVQAVGAMEEPNHRLTTFGILIIGAIGIVMGLAMWGRRVIETIGRRITELTPTRGFAAEFGAAVTILLASRFALPVSTTHTLVGAVFGVGLARGVGALDLRVVRDIAASWIITLPAGAILAMLYYSILAAIFT
ncbi:MAG TPA: inorganic phosphate transporter, partial [Planctomycetota bacterium]|nr:inorganic phosphate transporter [Planctomycetota bacterium]